MKNVVWPLVVCLLAPSIAFADEGKGTVQVPLDAYQLLLQAQEKGDPPAPARYALGAATAAVQIAESGAAEVQVELTVRIFDAAWTMVPLLPVGTAVIGATDGDQAAQLLVTPAGLALGTKVEGEHRIVLRYRAQVSGASEGRVLALPLPAANGTELTATLPGAETDVAVIPAAAFSASNDGETTSITATLPGSSGVQISWRRAARGGYAISRAQYRGELRGDAIAWTASLDVEVFGGDGVVALLPKAITLSSVLVDGKPGTVLAEGETFSTLVKGRSRHRIEIDFETPVLREEGPPRVELSIPEIPISRFDVRLPGKKEVTVTPAGSVLTTHDKNGTLTTIHAPMTSALQLTWTEAVPDEIEEDVRANATIYHAAFAEEGVLHGRAAIAYEVTHGKTSTVRFSAPEEVQINKITADIAGVTDWRSAPSKPGRSREVTVFLDRKLSGTVNLTVSYERLFDAEPHGAEMMSVPLLSMIDVHRQRGMVALLSSAEMALKPAEQKNLSRVGENQLPAFFRQTLEMTVAHTFKYADAASVKLSVQSVPPERKEAKFDAEVDTLISLADVTLKGSATVRINVKSGKMDVLRLELPPDVTLLNLTAPSKRSHTAKVEEGVQRIDLHFTQEMEGEFPVDLEFERIIAAEERQTTVPAVRVVGAEPEQGRIAVEALTAVEVRAATTEHLSLVDVNDLPQQLVLKTRNPIRLAYKYVQAGPQLVLEVTRHKELETQIATIERAHYRTLFTRDGLAVTTVRFLVKNSRKQFLELCLPEQTEIWSVFVDGKAEKPALDVRTDDDETPCSGLNVLVKVINSAQGFPVELVYKTKTAEIGSLGTVSATLPRPDMVVTDSRWDVFLPDGVDYRTPETNMRLVVEGAEAGAETLAEAGKNGAPEMLRVAVPMAGLQFSFEKLYANQGEDPARFSIPYASGGGRGFASLLAFMGTALFWAGAFLLLRPHRLTPPRVAGGAMAVGAMIAGLSMLLLGAGGMTVVLVSLVAIAAGGAAWFRSWRR